jgi:DNA-binding MarR family transcriptional regulator
VAAVRAFNRFGAFVIGLAQGLYLDMPYPLTEARLLFELARRDVTPVPDLRRVLDIDPGYLSRVLSRFEADGLITRARSGDDARRQEIRLTADGCWPRCGKSPLSSAISPRRWSSARRGRAISAG